MHNKICIPFCHYRGKGKLKDNWGSGQNSDRTFPRLECNNFKFGFVIADYLLFIIFIHNLIPQTNTESYIYNRYMYSVAEKHSKRHIFQPKSAHNSLENLQH
jgi:hypothetical protein